LFSSIQEVFELNHKLLKRFRERLHKFPTESSFGDILVEMLPQMQTYVDYVNNYEAAMDLYKELQKNPDWITWNQEAQQKANSKIDLPSLLITPIQRIPRYELLLREIIKVTSEMHKDYHNLVKAKELAIQMNQFINEKQKEQENKLKLIEIQQNIHSPAPLILTSANRLYIRDGPLKFTKNGQEGIVSGHVYVMNDMIILTKMVKLKKKVAR